MRHIWCLVKKFSIGVVQWADWRHWFFIWKAARYAIDQNDSGSFGVLNRHLAIDGSPIPFYVTVSFWSVFTSKLLRIPYCKQISAKSPSLHSVALSVTILRGFPSLAMNLKDFVPTSALALSRQTAPSLLKLSTSPRAFLKSLIDVVFTDNLSTWTMSKSFFQL